MFVVFLVALVGALDGCTRHSRLQGAVIWEGAADCTACQAKAVTLWPNGPARISLKQDSLYTARLDIEAAGDSDRCIFQFISGSWELPTRSFPCDPEQDVMFRSINTRRFSRPAGPDVLHLRVDVLSGSKRREIELLLDSQRYEVEWVQ